MHTRKNIYSKFQVDHTKIEWVIVSQRRSQIQRRIIPHDFHLIRRRIIPHDFRLFQTKSCPTSGYKTIFVFSLLFDFSYPFWNIVLSYESEKNMNVKLNFDSHIVESKSKLGFHTHTVTNTCIHTCMYLQTNSWSRWNGSCCQSANWLGAGSIPTIAL